MECRDYLTKLNNLKKKKEEEEEMEGDRKRREWLHLERRVMPSSPETGMKTAR